MSFITPTAFILAALLPLIIIMYLLKLRRTEQTVSSVYLWQRLVRDVEANAPWQRLRRNLLMILQLLFLIALIIALARPFIWTEGTGGSSVILVIDTSASMAAVDVTPTRLEAAKSQASQFVDEVPDDTRFTLITAGQETAVLAASSQDKFAVLQAIDNIQISMGSSDLATALQLTSAIASRQPDTEIIILSDGQVTLPEHISLKGSLRYYPIGISANNQAISNILLQENSSGDNSTLFVQVTNYGKEKVTRRLEIYADNLLIDASDLEIEAGGQAAYLRESIPVETNILEARLIGEDALPLDDHGWAVGGKSEAVKITLVTTGNRFLETALGLLPNVTLTTVTPADYEQSTDLDANLLIFDAYIPVALPIPDSSLLFIAPPASTDYFTVTGMVENPAPRHVELSDPLLTNISLAGVSVMDTVKILLPVWGHTVIAGDSQEASAPLLFTGTPEGRRVAVIAFNLQHSDLPLQVAFPLLVANLVNWLTPMTGNLSDSATPSGSLAVDLPLGVDMVTITAPDGSATRLPVTSGQTTLLNSTQTGVYRLNWGDNGQILAAVNLFSPQESNVKPVDNLSILAGSQGAGQQVPQQARRVVWRPFVLAALVLLLFEWLVYHRGTLARLWQTAKFRGGDVH